MSPSCSWLCFIYVRPPSLFPLCQIPLHILSLDYIAVPIRDAYNFSDAENSIILGKGHKRIIGIE